MLLEGDCLEKLRELEEKSIDLIYLDPPFFTQSVLKSKSRDNTKEYEFEDKWNSIDEYRLYIEERLVECRRVLKDTGSIFLHCDKIASHHLRIAMDNVFGMDNFQSDIVWRYKRWSNAKKGLLNNHQNIFFYSKTSDFKFNMLYEDYSETTNIDQILQDRRRNEYGKSEYKRDEFGNEVIGKAKKGVPLSDVWEIPYLNPKASERVGYPTQKPVLLIEKIIQIVTDENDIVLDPFMGSGTTLVAAKLLKRRFIGIDKSIEAVNLTRERLDNPIKTESALIQKGKEAYKNKKQEEIEFLNDLDAVVVQRNKGIDGFLKQYYEDKPVAVKIQKQEETIDEAINLLIKSSKKKQCKLVILIQTHEDIIDSLLKYKKEIDEIQLLIIPTYRLMVERCIK